MDHLVLVAPSHDWAPNIAGMARDGRTDRDPLDNFLFDQTTIIWPVLTGARIVYHQVGTCPTDNLSVIDFRVQGEESQCRGALCR